MMLLGVQRCSRERRSLGRNEERELNPMQLASFYSWARLLGS